MNVLFPQLEDPDDLTAPAMTVGAVTDTPAVVLAVLPAVSSVEEVPSLTTITFLSLLSLGSKSPSHGEKSKPDKMVLVTRPETL